MAYTTEPTTAGKKPPCYGPHGGVGDIDGDGRVTSADATIMGQASIGDRELSTFEKGRADLNGDGTPADSADVTLLNNFSVGSISTFPACSKPGYTTEPDTTGRKPPCYGPHGGIGDIRGDGRVGADDVTIMSQASIGDRTLSQFEASRADLNGDGTPADSADVTLLNNFSVGSISTFPACGAAPVTGIDPVTTPDMRSLEPGTYNIVISKSGYDTVYAKITVSSTGTVTCNDVTGVPGCGSDYPRVTASGTAVKVHMAAAGTAPSGYTEWLAGKGGINNITLPNVFELKDEFIGLSSTLGFMPTLPQIMDCKDAVLGL